MTDTLRNDQRRMNRRLANRALQED